MFGIIIILLLKTGINEVYGLSTIQIPNKYDMIKQKTKHDYYGNINFNIPNNNYEKKFCVNCKYYLPFLYSESNHRTKFAKCNKFLLQDIKYDQEAISCIYPITNKAIFDYFEFCKDCRKDENKCGIEGKCFEEKISV